MATFEKRVEQLLPTLLGSAAFGFCLFGQNWIWRFILSSNIQYKDLFGLLFDLNAIFLAFLFSYFAFIQTADNPFLDRVRKSKTFSTFISHTKSTMWASVLLLIATIVMVAVSPVPGKIFEFHNFLFSTWSALVVLVVTKFAVLNRTFWALISQ